MEKLLNRDLNFCVAPLKLKMSCCLKLMLLLKFWNWWYSNFLKKWNTWKMLNNCIILWFSSNVTTRCGKALIGQCNKNTLILDNCIHIQYKIRYILLKTLSAPYLKFGNFCHSQTVWLQNQPSALNYYYTGTLTE